MIENPRFGANLALQLVLAYTMRRPSSIKWATRLDLQLHLILRSTSWIPRQDKIIKHRTMIHWGETSAEYLSCSCANRSHKALPNAWLSQILDLHVVLHCPPTAPSGDRWSQSWLVAPFFEREDFSLRFYETTHPSVAPERSRVAEWDQLCKLSPVIFTSLH